MRTHRGMDEGYEEPVIAPPRDPYADLYHDDDRPLLLRAARIVVPWIALIAVVTVALSLWSEFRFESGRVTPAGEATSTAGSSDTTGTGGSSTATTTTDPTGSVPAGAPYVRVKANGLNMRADSSTESEVLRKLPSGTILAYIESTNGWYHVRDEAGAEGWVAAGGSFTELVRP